MLRIVCKMLEKRKREHYLGGGEANDCEHKKKTEKMLGLNSVH